MPLFPLPTSPTLTNTFCYDMDANSLDKRQFPFSRFLAAIADVELQESFA